MKLSLRRIVNLVWEIWGMPKAHIIMWGDDRCKSLFESFVGRHPRYPIIRNKMLGVALVELPDNVAEFRRGKKMQAFRTNCNSARSKGYEFLWVNPSQHLDEIMDINTSAEFRGGKPMKKSYFDRHQVKNSFANIKEIPAISDCNGKILAYVDLILAGEVAVFNRILGHAEHLNNGIMYLLVEGIAGSCIQQKNETGVPRWPMYDTFGLAQGEGGLIYFKQRLGFEPFRMKWTWKKR